MAGTLGNDLQGTPRVAGVAFSHLGSVIRDTADMERLIDAEEAKCSAFNNNGSSTMQAEAEVSACPIESTSSSMPSKGAYRPVRDLPYDQLLYPNGNQSRDFFRGFKDVMQNRKSRAWTLLALVVSKEQLQWLRDYFDDVKCPYDRYGRLIDPDAILSDLTILCYKTNKKAQDRFLKNSVLRQAF